MGVNNLAEYVKYHQDKLRAQSASSSSSAAPKKRGVNILSSQTSFSSAVTENSSDKLIVVDAFATWCGPCKAIAPAIVEFSKDALEAALAQRHLRIVFIQIKSKHFQIVHIYIYDDFLV